jgi:hypothetical protein
MTTLRWPAGSLFLLALLVPVLLKLALVRPDRLFEPHFIAQELLAHGEFRYRDTIGWNYNYQFPVYPFLVAILYSFGQGAIPVLVFHVLLGAGTAFLAYRITLLMDPAMGSKGACLAMLLVGLDPFTAFYHVRMVHPFALDMFLSMLLLYLSLSIDPHRWRDLLKWAVVAGIAVLDRSTLLVFALPLFLRSVRRPQALVRMAAVLLLIALPSSLWLVRNKSIYGEWSLNSSSGQNLWIGIQKETQGTAQMSNGNSWLHLLDREDVHRLEQLDAVERSHFFTAKWRQELEADPGLWRHMMGVKLVNFWLFRDALGVDQPQVGEWVARSFKVLSVTLLIAAVFALAMGGGVTRQVLVTVLVLSLFQAFFYVETRHKLLVQPLLIIVALVTIRQLIQRMRRHHV